MKRLLILVGAAVGAALFLRRRGDRDEPFGASESTDRGWTPAPTAPPPTTPPPTAREEQPMSQSSPGSSPEPAATATAGHGAPSPAGEPVPPAAEAPEPADSVTTTELPSGTSEESGQPDDTWPSRPSGHRSSPSWESETSPPAGEPAREADQGDREAESERDPATKYDRALDDEEERRRRAAERLRDDPLTARIDGETTD